MSEQEQQDQQSPESPENSAPETDMAARVAELEAQVRDVQLRAQAEIQNIHKRSEREVENARKYALDKFAGSLIDVVDNLERAIAATPADNDATQALRDGIALTHKAFLEALKRNGVEQVNPVGEPFNADLHQAVSMQPSATAEPNTVSAVLAKGYALNGRLLRPAMVVVATAG
ncbi:MAG: nucleotide exchange factor GrpE [bacterium]|nr:nucleotide exchange factor GrpE [bacterium]